MDGRFDGDSTGAKETDGRFDGDSETEGAEESDGISDGISDGGSDGISDGETGGIGFVEGDAEGSSVGGKELLDGTMVGLREGAFFGVAVVVVEPHVSGAS